MGKVETGSITFDIAARQAHVVGAGPRIASLPNEGIPQKDWDVVNAVRAGAGAGPATEMPEYMRLMLKHPTIFRPHMEMGSALYNGRIPPRERELAILRCGWLQRAPYEWGEHVDIGQRYGVTKEEIQRITEGSAAPGWSEHEAAILKAVEEILTDLTVSDATWAVLAKTWDEQQLLEFPMMVGQYVCTALVQNTLRIRLENGNPGLTYR